MANSQLIFLLVGAICLMSLAGVAQAAADNHFFVQGMVYCDTCRIQFMTRVSHMLDGTLQQEHYSRNSLIQFLNKDRKLGLYSIPVDGDHEDDICQIRLVKSPIAECSEIPTDIYSQQAAKVSLTNNNGEATPVRNANPLGFMRKESRPECPEVLKLDFCYKPNIVLICC